MFLVCVQVDDRGLGWLSAEDTMIALRVINRSLTDAEEHYITRVCVFLCQTSRYVKICFLKDARHFFYLDCEK